MQMNLANANQIKQQTQSLGQKSACLRLQLALARRLSRVESNRNKQSSLRKPKPKSRQRAEPIKRGRIQMFG